jgi:hypothetical protein
MDERRTRLSVSRWGRTKGFWRRRALAGGAGLSLVIGALSAAPAYAAVPDAPTNVTASAVAGQTTASVSWAAPASDGGNPITGYEIRAQPGDKFGVTGADVTTGTVEGLTMGVTYTFTVRAKNVEGSSLPSAKSAPVTFGTPAPAPGAPTGVTAVAGATSVRVDWTAPTDTGGIPLTKFRVSAQPALSTGNVDVPATETGVDVVGLADGVSYTFTVKAYNDSAWSTASDPTSPVALGGGTGGAAVPDAPVDIVATPGDGAATISWTAPADNGSPILEYLVNGRGTTVQKTVAGTTTTLLFDGLTNGTTYKFKVAARNAVGVGTYSVFSNDVTPTAARTPAGPTFNLVFSPGDFTGDGHSDVVGRKPNGELWLYAGNGAGGWAASGRRIGTGWGGFDTIFGPGDLSGDRKPDVVGRKPNGELWLYAGNGTGGWAASGRRIGTGWNIFDTVFGPRDFTGDNRNDVIGRKPNGELWLYAGNGAGGWAGSGRRIGTGWQVFDRVFGPRDFTGDRRADVIGRKPNGELWLYAGNGAGGWSAKGRRIGTSWQVFDQLFGPGDFTGDGRNDVIGRRTNGELWLYAGNGAGGWAAAGRRIGTNW